MDSWTLILMFCLLMRSVHFLQHQMMTPSTSYIFPFLFLFTFHFSTKLTRRCDCDTFRIVLKPREKSHWTLIHQLKKPTAAD